ncbi:hypothetical protein ES288_A13G248700v1 [Gossypium darwinii]|uniref:Uncharacterized protein n=1 Tax=Gossypium darwinii TaxID=34276 RepID=A0A5D2E486_GOSDA|nr:hypothetical protein ES288_A13G248700v1 [Gossypium darwinii]
MDLLVWLWLKTQIPDMEMNIAPNIKSCRRNLPRSSIGRANLADFFEQSWQPPCGDDGNWRR